MSASARAFVCECGSRSCRAQARLTDSEYSELRLAGLKMIVVAAHDPPSGIVVLRRTGWVAVGRRRQINKQPATPAHESRPGLEVRDCPTCKVETIVSDFGTCLWCSSSLLGEMAA